MTLANITSLAPGEIFVFGSNLAGRHGKGAALVAAKKFGAIYGVGTGPTGRCYAIPTKDEAIRTLPLEAIGGHVEKFLEYARLHPEARFLVTEIGCGLAGYQASQIAPLFGNSVPANVELPASFHRCIKVCSD